MRAILKAPFETALESCDRGALSQIHLAQSGYPISRRDVRYWHLADMDADDEHVCFWG